MSRILSSLCLVIAGAAIGAGSYALLNTPSSAATSAAEKPLYWVAPMDPGFRSDKPGKSPMGMDLVPVYAEQGGTKDSPGTVRITPDVQNNLGVRTAQVAVGPWQTTIDTVGYVDIDQQQRVNVTPRVAGWIEKQYVDATGETVDKGQPLYTFYSPDLVNAQNEMLTAMRRGDSEMIRSSEDRLRALQVPNSAIKALKKQKVSQRTITIFASTEGVVHQLTTREGDYVKPGTAMFSIVDLHTVWVNAEVFERDAALLHVGSPVLLTVDALPSRKWQGKVDYIYPELDAVTRTIKVRISVANDDLSLQPNMFARVQIENVVPHDVLQVPRQAVIRTGSQARVVLALGEGRFKSVAVDIGRVSDQSIEVVHGLQSGDRVVTSAQFLIDSESNIDSDLQRITMSEPSMPGMNHNQMDHSQMNHESMDHSQMHEGMDHSQVDHEAMDQVVRKSGVMEQPL